MKKYFYNEEKELSVIELSDSITLPFDVDTSKATLIEGEISQDAVKYDSVIDALVSVVDVFAEEMNQLEIANVNDLLSLSNYVSARMRKRWESNVTPSESNPDMFTLSLSSRLVENDLMSDDFTASLFKKDITFLYDIGLRIAKGEKLGNRWKKAIKAFYNGYTGDDLLETIKDGFTMKEGKAWTDYSITDIRMEFLRGCFVTTHALKTDIFGTTGKKAKFVNVLLSTDTILAKKKAQKAQKA